MPCPYRKIDDKDRKFIPIFGRSAGVRETGFLFYFRLCGKGFEKKPGFWVGAIGWGARNRVSILLSAMWQRFGKETRFLGWCDRLGCEKPGFYFTFGYVAKVWERNPVSGLHLEFHRLMKMPNIHQIFLIFSWVSWTVYPIFYLHGRTFSYNTIHT